VGFGGEMLFVVLLGLLILGPKGLHTILAHVSRLKAEVQDATRGWTSQLAAELDAAPASGNAECSHVLVGDCEICSTYKSETEFPEPAKGALIES